jgi:hypothetical protein
MRNHEEEMQMDDKYYCAAAEMSDTAWEAEKKALDAMGIDGCPLPPDAIIEFPKEEEEKKDDIPW